MEDHVHSESCNHDHHEHEEVKTVSAGKEALAAMMAGTATPEQLALLQQFQAAKETVDPRVARNRRKAAIRKAKNAASSKEERRAAAKGMSFETLEAQRRAREEQTPQRTRSAIREMKRRQKRAIRQMETRYRSEVRGVPQHQVILDEVQDIK